eukprot:1690673-Amphidinium_carterae.1
MPLLVLIYVERAKQRKTCPVQCVYKSTSPTSSFQDRRHSQHLHTHTSRVVLSRTKPVFCGCSPLLLIGREVHVLGVGDTMLRTVVRSEILECQALSAFCS